MKEAVVAIPTADGCLAYVDAEVATNLGLPMMFGTVPYPMFRGQPVHRLALGLIRGDGHIVHHINGNRRDARLVNLWVCVDKKDHGIWHQPIHPTKRLELSREYQRKIGFTQPSRSLYADESADPYVLAAENLWSIYLALEARATSAREYLVFPQVIDRALFEAAADISDLLEGVAA